MYNDQIWKKRKKVITVGCCTEEIALEFEVPNTRSSNAPCTWVEYSNC